MDLTPDALVSALADSASEAGVTIRTVLEPLAGPFAPVKPAVYQGGHYQLDRRWDDTVEPPEVVDAVVIDNVPSQANRLEAALERLRARLRLPEMVLDLSGLGALPPHLPRSLSSFRFPHRQADAYLRDALLDGEPFARTSVGRTVLGATGDDPQGLLEWFPQALLFGFWQSHLGGKRSQAKLARSWVSEIVGYRPATLGTRVHALKGDPLNLSVDERAEFDPKDLLAGWTVVEGEKKVGGGKTKERLSEIGHGQVPVPSDKEAPGGVSFARIEQRSTVSFAALRRIRAGSNDANAAARALVAALGLAAHVTAFGRGFHLRSGCDLRPAATTWTWLGVGADAVRPPTPDEAGALVDACAARAERAGLPVGTRWASVPLRLEPAANLADAIRRTWPSAD
ncbi:MAG TPA: type I-U CRISPR-associated RAMP protein Csb1/Cas7u [Candidatus Micrarchaeia archaeon]|nr:type I-U CRISPR-associated RAMP protein Csb1/Cas7u [Candidatus Micrarchaeia archaeon]